ncbi:hypothetical protein HXX76_000560 [Chlamydomonas incerta]|uniref:Apple domain-containing protein n=1 Tax=Chlamydomonas incerta TaxID=51695 RepID=A0A836B2U3_CHLIN|nr:hypothetical protein HXX76_000560 [Chlamydomonas incerta]|eukprot:KAG2445957.1 hypothetical protein HXX76_000560 [Chlamydomonas incerta]
MTVFVSSSAGCLNNDCGRYSLPSVTDSNNATYLATTATNAAIEVVLGFGSWQRDIVEAVLVAPPGTGQETWLQGVSITLQSGAGVDVASCGAGVSAAAPLDRITLHCQRITGPVDRVVVRRPASAASAPLAFASLELYVDDCPSVLSGQLSASPAAVTWLPSASKFSNGYRSGSASSYGLAYAADSTCGANSASSELGPAGASGPTLTVKLSQSFSGVLVVASQHSAAHQNDDIWVSRTTAYAQGLRCAQGPAVAAGGTRVVYCPAMRGVAYVTIVRAPQAVAGGGYLDMCELTLTGHRALDTGIPQVPEVAHFDAAYGLEKDPSTGELTAWRDVDSASRPRNILNFTAGCTEWTSSPGNGTFGVNFNGNCMGRNYNDLPPAWNRNLTGQFTVVTIARFGVDPNTTPQWASNEFGITDTSTPGNGADVYYPIGHMPLGRWTFEAVTRHPNGANTVYFHKSEVTEGFSTDITSGGTNAIGPDNLVVGADYATGSKYLLNGQVAVVLIYNRMLVAAEVGCAFVRYGLGCGYFVADQPDTPRLNGMAAQGGWWGNPGFARPGLYFSWFGSTSVTYRMRWLYADGTRGNTVGSMSMTSGTYACPTLYLEFTMPMSWQLSPDRIMLFQRIGYQGDSAGNLSPGYPAVAGIWMDLFRIPWTYTNFWLLGPANADRAIGLGDCLVNGPVPPYVAGWRWSGGAVGTPLLYDATAMPRLTATGGAASIAFFHLVEEYGSITRYYPSLLRFTGVTNSQPVIYVQLTAPWQADRALVLQRSDDGVDLYDVDYIPAASAVGRTWFVLRGWNTPGRNVTQLTPMPPQSCESVVPLLPSTGYSDSSGCYQADCGTWGATDFVTKLADNYLTTGVISSSVSTTVTLQFYFATAQTNVLRVIITPMAPPSSPTDASWFQGIKDEVVSGAVKVSLAYSASSTSPLHMSIWVSQDPAFERSGKKCAYGVSGPGVTAAALLSFNCPVMKSVAYVTVHRELRPYSASTASLQISEISFSVRKWMVPSPPPPPSPPPVAIGGCMAVVPLSSSYVSPVGCYAYNCTAWGFPNLVDGQLGTTFRTESVQDLSLSVAFPFVTATTNIAEVQFHMPLDNIQDAQNMTIEVMFSDSSSSLCASHAGGYRAGEWVTVACLPRSGTATGIQVTRNNATGSLAFAELVVLRDGCPVIAPASLSLAPVVCPWNATAAVMFPGYWDNNVAYSPASANDGEYINTFAHTMIGAETGPGAYIQVPFSSPAGVSPVSGAFRVLLYRRDCCNNQQAHYTIWLSGGAASNFNATGRRCASGAWLTAPAGLPSMFTCPSMTNVNLVTIQRVAPSPAMLGMGSFVVELAEIVIEGYLTPAVPTPPPPPATAIAAPPTAYPPPPPPLMSSCITVVPIASIDGPFGCYLSNCATYGLAAAQDGNALTALRTGGSAATEPSIDFVLATPTKRITEIKLKAPAYGPEEFQAIRVDLVAGNGSLVTCTSHVSAYQASDDIMVACPFTPLTIARVRLRRRITGAPNYKVGYLLGVAEIVVLVDACPEVSESRFKDLKFYPVRWSSSGAVLWPGPLAGDVARWGPQNANDDVVSVYAPLWDYYLAHSDGTGPSQGPGEYLQVPLETPASGAVRVSLWHRTQSPLHATYYEVWVSSTSTHRTSGRLCASGITLAEKPTNFTGPFTFNCPPFGSVAYVTIQRNNPPVFSGEKVVDLTEVDLEIMYADGSPASQQELVALPVGYGANDMFSSYLGQVTACRSNDVVQALWVAAEGTGSWVTYLGITLCRDGTGTGPTNKLTFGTPPAGGSSGLNITCPGGFDAIRGEESAMGQAPLPITALSFRCSSTSAWSSPVGSGNPGVTRNASVSACPPGGVIYGFNMTGNATALGNIRPFCVQKPGAKDWDPIKRCPQTVGYTLVPGWYPAGPTSLYTIATLPPWVGVDIAVTACAADPSCTSIGYSVDTFGNTTFYTYNSTNPAEFAAAMGNTAYTGVDGCSGTLAPSSWAGGPSQWYCVSGVRTDAPVLSTISAGPNDCANTCDNDPNCESWTMDASGSTCTTREYGFAATQWVDDSSTGVTCVIANDPWLCPVYGWTLRGVLLNSSIHTIPETCKAACAFAAPACTHYTYTSSNLRCQLFGSSLMTGGVGINGPVAFNIPDRVCMATPQHPKLGQPIGPTRAAHSSMCWPGVRLVGTGGTPAASPSPAPAPTPAPAATTATSAECARQCMANSTCVHWSLRLGGGCDLYGADAVVAGQAAGGYGPDPAVAQSCLANVQGTFHCVPARQGLAFELDNTFSNVTTRTDCAKLCKSSTYCVGFVYYIPSSTGTSSCRLMARAFAGAADVTSVNQQYAPLNFQACVRTLSLQQGGSTQFQGLAVQPGLPTVNGSCDGFYARSPRGITPFMCIPGLVLPAAITTITTTLTTARECETLCRSYPSNFCHAFYYVESAPGIVTCEIKTNLFASGNLSPYIAGIGATNTTTCVPATDPWYCLPYGIGITGEVLAGYPVSSGTGEACAYACQTTPTCSAYLHSPDSATASCTLFRAVFNGPNGTTALLADGRARACLKTPQFSHPANSLPFWSHMCWTGVDLGGTVVSTLGNVDGHTCAKWCAAYGYGCSHWQLSSAGLCEARTGPLWTNAGGMVVYGPQPGIAAACLRSTGTFMCLRDGAEVAYSLLGTSSGVASRSACAALCLGNAACEVMAYYINTTCALGSGPFVGSDGTNGFDWSTSTLTTSYCLRTPYFGGPLFGSSLTPSPPPSPVPPSPAPPSPEPPSVFVSGGSAGTAGIIVNTILSGVVSPPPPVAADAFVPDTTAPVVTLFGAEEVVVEVYGTYSESGAVAVDDRDGQLAVDIQGTVNTSILSLGLPIQILYLAADRTGNIGSITRSVYVVDTCSDKGEFRCPVTKECSVFRQCLFIPDPQAINKTVAVNGQAASATFADTTPPNVTFVGSDLEIYDVQTAAGNLTVAVEIVYAGTTYTDRSVLAFDYLNDTSAEGAGGLLALNLTNRVVATISAPASADTDAVGVSTTIFTDIPTGNSTSEGSPYTIQYDVADDGGNKATALKLVFILCEPPNFVCPDNTTFEGTCSQGGLCQFNTSKITTNDTGLPRSNETAVAILTGPPDPDNLIDALMVPAFGINSASSVSISQYLPYVPCRGGATSNNCDPGAKASLRSLGDLNHRIVACADKVKQNPQPYSVVGLQYCGIDTASPGTYTITYHLSWPSVGTLIIKRQLLVVERCVGESLCPDGFCSVDQSCARNNVSSTISSFIVATGDANGLLPNSTSLSTNTPPALFLRNGEVVNSTVVVPRGTPYMVCAADQVPTQDRPCEPLGTALDVEDGNITAMITLCPPEDCAPTQCRDHRADRKQPSECGIDTVNATVGSSFRVQLVVFDSKGANATAERLITVIKPCELLESYCRITRNGMPVYVCSNVTCETLEPLNDEITRSGGGLSVVPPRLFLLPGLLTNNLTLAERDQSIFLTYGKAAPMTVTLLDFSLFPGGSALASTSLSAATTYANTLASNAAARARVLSPIFTAFGIQSGSVRAIVVDTQPAVEARYFDNTTQNYYIVRMVLRVTTGSSDFTSATSALDVSNDQPATADNSTSSARRRVLPVVASLAVQRMLEPGALGPAPGIVLGTVAQSPRRGLMAARTQPALIGPAPSPRSSAQQLWEERFASLHGALDSLGALLGLEGDQEEGQGSGRRVAHSTGPPGLSAGTTGSRGRRRFTLEASTAAQDSRTSWHLPAGARLAGARFTAAEPRRALSDEVAQVAGGAAGSGVRALFSGRRRLQVVVNSGCGGPALAAPPNSSFSALGLADVRTISSSCGTPQAGDMDVALTVLAGMMADLERMSTMMLEDEASMDTTLMVLDPKFSDVDNAYQTTYTDFAAAAGVAYGSMLERSQVLMAAVDRSAAAQAVTTTAVSTLLSLMQALLNEMQQITARADLTTKAVLDGLADDGTLTDEELANYTSCLFLRGKEAAFSFRTRAGSGTGAGENASSASASTGAGARRRALLGPDLLYSSEGPPAGAAASPAAMQAAGGSGTRQARSTASGSSWVPGWVWSVLSPAAWFQQAALAQDAQQALQRRSLLSLANGEAMESFYGYDLPDGGDYDYSLWDVRNLDRARWIGLNNRVLVGMLLHQVRRSSAELERAKGTDGYVCRDSSFTNLIVGCNTTNTTATTATTANSTTASSRAQDLGGIGNDPVFSRHSALYQAELDPAEYYNTSQGSPELNRGGLPYGFFHQPAGRLAAGYPLVLDKHLSAKRAEQAITYIRDGGYLSETLTKTLRVQLVSYNADAQVFGYFRVDLDWLDSGLIWGATRLLALPAISYGSAVASAQVEKFLPDFFLIVLCCGYLLVTAYDIFVQLHRQAQMRKLRTLLREGKKKEGELDTIHEADDDDDDNDHVLGIGDTERKVVYKHDGTKLTVKMYKPRMSVGWVVFETTVCVLMFTSLGFLFAYTAKLADKDAFPSRFELYDADGYAPARYFLPLRQENVTVTQQSNGTSNTAASPTPGSANRWQLPEGSQLESASDFYDRVDDMYDLLMIYTFLQGFVLAMIVIRWLHCLSFQPRLSAISGTLALAAPDIIHFFIVIVICAVMFGAAGCIVFGPDEVRLSGYGDAFQLMLSYVMLREDGGVFKALLDKIKQRDEGTTPTEVMAGLLYAIGPLFFVFIMSNFIMAFLAWPYGLLKFATRDAPGVPQDIRRMLGILWQRMRHRAPSNRRMEKWFKRQVVPEARDRGLMYRIRETMANAYQSIAFRGKASAVAAAPAAGQMAPASGTAPPMSAPPVATAATRRKSLVKMAPGMPAMNADALAAALLSVSRINFDVEGSAAATASHMATTKLDPMDSDEEHSGSTPSGFGTGAAAASGDRLDSAPALASPQTPGPVSADGGSARPASQDAFGKSTPLPKMSGSGASSRLRGGKSTRMSAPGQANEASALVHTVMANLLARYGHEKVVATDAPPPAPQSRDSTGGGGDGADSTEVSEFGEARRRITVDGSLGSVTDAGRVRGPGAGGPSEWARMAPGALVRRSITGQIVGAEGAGSPGGGSAGLAGTDGGTGSPLSAATPGSQVASPPATPSEDDTGASASASPRVGSLAARPPRLQTVAVGSRLGRRTSQSSFKGLAGTDGVVSPSGSAQSPVMTSGAGGQAALTSPRGEASAAPTSASGAKAGRQSMSGPSPLGAGAAMTAGAMRRNVDAHDTQDASSAHGFEGGVSTTPKLPPIGVKPQFGGLPPMTAAGERGRHRGAGELDSPGSSARQSGPGTSGVALDAQLDQLREHRGEDWTGPAPDARRNLEQAKAWLTFKHAVKRTPDDDQSAGGSGGGADAEEGLASLAPRMGSVMVDGQIKVLDPTAAAALEAEERAAAERGVVQGLRAPMRRASAVLLPEPDMMSLAPILSVDPASQLPALPSTQVEQPDLMLSGPAPGGTSPSGAAEARRAGMKQGRAWGSVKRSTAREAAQAMLGMLDNLRGSGGEQAAPRQLESSAAAAAPPAPPEPQEPQPWFSRPAGLNALAPNTQRRLNVAAGGPEQELLVVDSDGADTDGSGPRGSGARHLRARGPGGAGPVAEATEAGAVPFGADGEQVEDPAALSAPAATDAPVASRRAQGVKFAVESLPTSDSDDDAAGPFAAHGRPAALVAVAGGGSRDGLSGGLAAMVLSMLAHLEALLAQLQAAIAELKLMSEVLAAMLGQVAGLGPDSAPEARQAAWQAARKAARDLLLAYKRDALLTAPLPLLETKRLPPLPLALPATGMNALGISKVPLPPLRTNPMFRQRSTRRTGSTRRGTLPPMPMPGVLYSLQSLARSDGAVLAAAQSSGGAALEILHHVEEQLETRLGMPLARRKSLKRVADEVAAELVRAERAESRAHVLQQVASLRHGSAGHSGYGTSGYGASGYGASGYGGAAALAAAAAAADSAYGAGHSLHQHQHPHQHRSDGGRSVQAAGSHVSGTHRRGWGARRRAMAAAEEKWLEELPADEQLAALAGRAGSFAPGKRKSRLLLGGADSRAASRVMERDFSPAAMIGGGREGSAGGAGADAMEAGTPLARSDAGKAGFKSGGVGAGGLGGLGILLGSPTAGSPARMRLPPLKGHGAQPQSDLPL